jgi:asparagine synthase (glutamine-hydrolysing)
MCGILGVVSKEAIDVDRTHAALDLIAHRGPDGDNSWHDTAKHIWLGHRRLSIIDLSTAGNQPMHSPDGRFLLTFNGEIYNYVELRQELIAAGATFQSDSDSEVIIEGYRVWGRGVLAKLNGMFGLALLDRFNNVMLCARDRYGEKPFLFTRRPSFFAFASEFKALLALPGVPHDHDELRVVTETCQPGSSADRQRQTVFSAIEQLLPGEAMLVDCATLETRTWRWFDIDLKQERRFADPRDAMAEFRDLFVDSVKIRMRSDVEVGSCLSGGLDSSAIVGAARHLLGPDAVYHTFTGRFPGTAADEWHYAQMVVKSANVVSHVVEPTVDRFMTDLPNFMWHNELPVGSSSQFAQWCVFRLAKEHGVTVLLDGQGADELLGGYEQYFALYIQALKARGDKARLARELPEIERRYPAALMNNAMRMKSAMPQRLRHALAHALNRGSDVRFGIKQGYSGALTEHIARQDHGSGDPLRDALYEDSFEKHLTTLLRYGDRNSMAHSREVRLPFCDHRLAELALSMPPEFLMGEVQTKRPIREGLREFMPEAIATRWNKQGFRPPQDLWFTSPAFLELMQDTLTSTSFRQSEIWDQKWWLKILDRIRDGELGLGWNLWQPFIHEMWKQHFLARATNGAAAVNRLAA